MRSGLSSRRRFLKQSAGLVAICALSRRVSPGEPPPVSNPRATSGDDRHEPNWQERLSITVGPQKADIVGTTDKAIQAAVDYVVRLGGGTVRVLAGEYRLRNSLFLASGVRIVGSGGDTVLSEGAVARGAHRRRLRLVRSGDHAGFRTRFSGGRRHLPAVGKSPQWEPAGPQAHAGGARRRSL